MLRTLPGFPRRYCDFVDRASQRLDSARLLARGRSLTAGIDASARRWFRGLGDASSFRQRQESSGATVVLGVVDAAPLGGPLSNLFKVLSVVQLSELLRNGGVSVVPMVLIAPAKSSDCELYYLDAAGNLVAVPASAGARLSAESIAGIARRLGVAEDDEVLTLLLECYAKSDDIASGMAAFYADLLSHWDCPVVRVADLPAEAGSEFSPLKGDRVSDAAAVLIGPEDFDGATDWTDGSSDAEVTPFWPSASGTLLDSRARKTLDRYGLDIGDTYEGVSLILDRLGYEGLAPAVVQKFSSIQKQLSTGVSDLEQCFQDDRKLWEAVASTSRSISYQLDNLRERFEPVAARRVDSARRQLNRLCNLVAPGGRAQQTTLAAFYFLVRFSRAIIERLYSQLDATRFEHQVINVE